MGVFSGHLIIRRIFGCKIWRYYIWVGKCVFEADLLSELPG